MPELRPSCRHRIPRGPLAIRSVLLSLLSGVVLSPWLTSSPTGAAELLEIQLESLDIPVRLDQLDLWIRRDAASSQGTGGSAGSPVRGPRHDAETSFSGASTAHRSPATGAAPSAPDLGDLEVWLNLMEPRSRHGLIRLLQAPLLRDRSFGSQLLDSWAGGQMLLEVGDLLTTPEGRSTAPELQATLRQLLLQRGEVSTLTLLRAMPQQRLRLRLDSLLSLAAQWRRQIEQQGDALSSLQTLALPRHDTRLVLPERRQPEPLRMELSVPHRREALPIDLWPSADPAARHRPWLLVLPGLGGNADQLGWFAGALAQRGWSVAVPQHPGSDGLALQEALAGRLPPPGASTLAIRLQDVEAVLAAQRRGRLPLPGNGVVLVGHSLGGLTALLAAGAQPEPGLAQRCSQAIDRLPIGNPSRLLQCELVSTGVPAPLARPGDLRALVLFNGFGSLLWPRGATAALPVPVLMVGGSLDLVTPPLEEQLQLFLPAGDPRSRLVLVEGGSHFSPVRMQGRQEAVLRLGSEWVGVDPAMVQALLLGLGGEFLQSLEAPQRLPPQIRSQQGVRAFVLDPRAARRWRGRLQS
ncbi:MAG: alpha/beta fold hydrolase [Cyanobium sp.]